MTPITIFFLMLAPSLQPTFRFDIQAKLQGWECIYITIFIFRQTKTLYLAPFTLADRADNDTIFIRYQHDTVFTKSKCHPKHLQLSQYPGTEFRNYWLNVSYSKEVKLFVSHICLQVRYERPASSPSSASSCSSWEVCALLPVSSTSPDTTSSSAQGSSLCRQVSP